MRPSILAFALLGLASCVRTEAAETITELRSVRTAPVVFDRIAPVVRAAGTLAARDEITLSFKVGGIVERRLVDEGDQVRAGDTLALLDLAEIDARVAQARSALEKSERDLARTKRLLADSVATLEQAQNAETGVAVARADLTAAAFNRRFAVIVAPATGVVLRTSAEPGELVGGGQQVLTLGSRARGVVVRAGLADRDAVRLKVGDRATIRFDALPGRTFNGRVSRLAAATNAATGTVEAEIAVTGVDDLVSGLVAHVELAPSTTQRSALIPTGALLEADGSRGIVFVLAADGRTVQRREVTIAFLAGENVAIAAGLDGVTAVITDGAAWLNDGQTVRIVQ